MVELTQITLEDASFKVIKLFEKDFADGAWMLRTEAGDPFLLFVDSKSARINVDEKKPPARLAQPCQLADLPGGGKQVSRLFKIANETKILAGVSKGSIAEALKEGRYLYVYISTGLRETFGVDDKVLHLGGKDAMSFLSFCKEFYILNRVSTQ